MVRTAYNSSPMRARRKWSFSLCLSVVCLFAIIYIKCAYLWEMISLVLVLWKGPSIFLFQGRPLRYARNLVRTTWQATANAKSIVIWPGLVLSFLVAIAEKREAHNNRHIFIERTAYLHSGMIKPVFILPIPSSEKLCITFSQSLCTIPIWFFIQFFFSHFFLSVTISDVQLILYDLHTRTRPISSSIFLYTYNFRVLWFFFFFRLFSCISSWSYYLYFYF